jgi:maleylpyruvate isomerase
MKLYGYFRSSAAYRVRIALNLKGIDYQLAIRHLRKGEQRDPAFLAINPQGLVPALETDEGAVLIQSLAIIEYLDETCPEPPLLPVDPAGRARVRALAQLIACEIHPLNNLRVLKYLKDPLGHDQPTIDTWYRHWVATGFEALEQGLSGASETGEFCHRDRPTLADVCLVPQVANARRFDCDLTPYPTIRRIDAACLELAPFQAAAPERQPDAE